MNLKIKAIGLSFLKLEEGKNLNQQEIYFTQIFMVIKFNLKKKKKENGKFNFIFL